MLSMFVQGLLTIYVFAGEPNIAVYMLNSGGKKLSVKASRRPPLF